MAGFLNEKSPALLSLWDETLGLPDWRTHELSDSRTAELTGWLAIFELIVYRLVFGEPQHMFSVFSISNKTTMIIQIVLLYTFGVFNKTQ